MAGRRLDRETVEVLARFVAARDLAAMRIVTGRPWNLVPRLLGMSAVTFAPFVLFREGSFSPGTPRGLALIAHEAHHLQQSRQLGRLRFYSRYLWGQLRCGFRHGQHVMEVPAIRLQRQVAAALRSPPDGE